MKNHEFRELADRNLSGLVWDERQQRKVLHAIGKEEKPMKKFSTSIILIFAILCISVSALAAGLMFSPRYEAGKAANQALEEQYGLTEDLLSMFHRAIEAHEDGTVIVTYTVLREDFPAAQMGDYTVEVKGNKAVASWSNDGKDVAGGLAAEAYGPEQLRMISYDYAASMQALRELGVLAQKTIPAPTPRLTGDEPLWSQEDQAAADQAMEKANQANEARLNEIAKAEAQGKISVQEASKIALAAIFQEYSFTEAQRGKLNYEPDSTYITYDNHEPQAHLMFWLWQEDGAQFTEKDGQYWVTINLNTGVIDDLLYDAALAGNG